MDDTRTTKRPWLAAVLSVAVTGLGHLYLRRWLRAVAWLGVTAAVTALVPEHALDAAAAGETFDVIALAPVLLAATLCALDAYLVAQRDRLRARASPTDDGETTHCPNCGGELDADLRFCHWCTTEFEAYRVTGRAGGDDG